MRVDAVSSRISGRRCSNLAATNSQKIRDCFNDFLQCWWIECGNLCFDEIAAGSEEFSRAGEAGDPQRTLSEAGVFELDGSAVAVRFTGDLTQDVVAAASIREDHGWPQLRP